MADCRRCHEHREFSGWEAQMEAGWTSAYVGTPHGEGDHYVLCQKCSYHARMFLSGMIGENLSRVRAGAA